MLPSVYQPEHIGRVVVHCPQLSAPDSGMPSPVRVAPRRTHQRTTATPSQPSAVGCSPKVHSLAGVELIPQLTGLMQLAADVYALGEVEHKGWPHVNRGTWPALEHLGLLPQLPRNYHR